jgi:DNA helicase-2/ATP-dependent DNA helicase PcrA
VVNTAGGPALLAHPAAPEAWNRLREWRAGRAKERSVPPYVVFDDRTLRMVAAQLPSSEAELLGVSGIGPAKLETYGSDLLAISEDAAVRWSDEIVTAASRRRGGATRT